MAQARWEASAGRGLKVGGGGQGLLAVTAIRGEQAVAGLARSPSGSWWGGSLFDLSLRRLLAARPSARRAGTLQALARCLSRAPPSPVVSRGKRLRAGPRRSYRSH